MKKQQLLLIGGAILLFAILLYMGSTVAPKNPATAAANAKNEADNLKKFLPKVLEQDYPEFEVVVVNDQSKDGTAAILKNFEKKINGTYSNGRP